jgi:hypothetical protein
MSVLLKIRRNPHWRRLLKSAFFPPNQEITNGKNNQQGKKQVGGQQKVIIATEFASFKREQPSGKCCSGNN